MNKKVSIVLSLFIATIALGQSFDVNPSVFSTCNVQQSHATAQVFGTLGQQIVMPFASPTSAIVCPGFIPQIRQLNFDPSGIGGEENPGIEIPEEFNLGQNYPNPFNPTTAIPFSLDQAGRAELIIYNVLGQILRNFDLSAYGAGHYELLWDGTTESGAVAPSGLLFYRLTTEQHSAVGRMLLLK